MWHHKKTKSKSQKAASVSTSRPNQPKQQQQQHRHTNYSNNNSHTHTVVAGEGGEQAQFAFPSRLSTLCCRVVRAFDHFISAISLFTIIFSCATNKERLREEKTTKKKRHTLPVPGPPRPCCCLAAPKQRPSIRGNLFSIFRLHWS